MNVENDAMKSKTRNLVEDRWRGGLQMGQLLHLESVLRSNPLGQNSVLGAE